MLESGLVTELSLDHDLGLTCFTKVSVSAMEAPFVGI